MSPPEPCDKTIVEHLPLRKSRSAIGVQVRILSISFLVILGLTSSLVVLLVDNHMKEIEEFHAREASSIARTIAVNTGLHLSGKTNEANERQSTIIPSDLLKIVASVKSLPHFHIAAVMGKGGEVWAATGPLPSNWLREDKTALHLQEILGKAPGDGVAQLLHQGKIDSLAKISDGTQLIGYALVVMDDAPILTKADTLRRKALIGAIVTALLGLLAFHLISRHVIARLRALTLAADRISAGHFDVKLPEESRRSPFSNLITGFETMAATIKTDFERINSVKEKLRNESLFNRTLLDTLGALVIVLDKEGRITHFNQACVGLSGYDTTEALGRKAWDFLLRPERIEMMQKLFDVLLREKRPNSTEYPIVAKTGTEFLISWSNTVVLEGDGEVKSVLLTGWDVTQERNTQIQLRASEERFHTLMQAAPVGIFQTDHLGEKLYINDVGARMLGTQPDISSWEQWLNLITPEDRARITAAWQKMANEHVAFREETRIAAVEVLINAVPLSHDGNESGFIGTITDISERVRAENALRDSEALFRALFDSAKDIIAVYDRDYACLMANQPALQLANQDSDAASGKKTATAAHHDAKPMIQCKKQIDKVFATARPIVLLRQEIWGMGGVFDIHLFPISDSAGEIFAVGMVARDVSMQKELEEVLLRRRGELEHIGRLNLLGEMSAILAHELNQPLASIQQYLTGCVFRLLEGKADKQEFMDILNAAIDQATRASTVVQKIRAFTRKREPEKTPLDINKLVLETIEFISTDLNRNQVQIHSDLHPTPLWVHADRILIEQVMLNLLRNAAQAMERMASGRTVTIRTEADDEGNGRVSVSDNGAGMEQVSLSTMFDPFVSTKQNANSLGLGLSICRSIVESHGGRIWAESRSGGGLVVHFTLLSANEGLPW